MIAKYDRDNAKVFYLRAKCLFSIKNYSASLSELQLAKTALGNSMSLPTETKDKMELCISDLKKQVKKEKKSKHVTKDK